MSKLLQACMGEQKYKDYQSQLRRVVESSEDTVAKLRDAKRLLGGGDCEEHRADQLQWYIARLEELQHWANQEIASVQRVVDGVALY